MRIILSLFLVCFTLISSVIAQDYKKDFEVIMSEFEKVSSYHISSSVKVYKNESKDKVVGKYKASVKASSEGTYTNINGVHMIVNKNYSVLVDPNSNTIQVQKVVIPSKKKTKDMILDKSVMSLLEKPERVTKLVSSKDGIKKYKISFTDSQYDYVLVTLNMNKKVFSKIELKYDDDYQQENNFIVITYDIFKYNASFDASTFTGDQYVLKKDNSFFLKEAYKNYSLITQN